MQHDSRGINSGTATSNTRRSGRQRQSWSAISGVLLSAGLISMAAGQVEPMRPVMNPTNPGPASPGSSTPSVTETPPMPGMPSVTAAPVATSSGPSYSISRFEVVYGMAVSNVPSPELLINTTVVPLGRVGNVYTEAREGTERVELRLGELTDATAQYDAMAIREVSRAVANNLRSRGMMAVLVGPSLDEVDGTGADLRTGRTTFQLTMIIGTVGEIRTLANGDRFSENRINNSSHTMIRENSPIQPGSFLQRDELEDYAFRLNRHPGRRVDLSVAPGSEKLGDVTLDYLVSENKPWYFVTQLSNTGTRNTDLWRQRFAFTHNQLTGQDDILNLDYSTAGFAEAHSFLGQYEFPLLIDRLRLNVFGAYNKYTASDVGIGSEQFRGNGWRSGAELSFNVFQHKQFFLDALGGFRWDHIETRNATAGIQGSTDYFIPHLGVRAVRSTDTAFLDAKIVGEWTQNEVSGTDFREVSNLGRIDPAYNYSVMKWDTNFAFYLEPILFPDKYRGDYRPVDANGNPVLWEPGMTLAHELAFSFRGQYAFGNRLIPNAEEVVGGFFSVRGYPESAVAGDNAFIASAEYRLHIPRLFGVSTESGQDMFGNSFRWQPQEAYGAADWDLIFRGFFDVGRTTINDIRSFERNNTLAGAGVGLELQIRRNIFVRMDWGVALRGNEQSDTKAGDNRLHFLLTLLF